MLCDNAPPAVRYFVLSNWPHLNHQVSGVVRCRTAPYDAGSFVVRCLIVRRFCPFLGVFDKAKQREQDDATTKGIYKPKKKEKKDASTEGI